MKTTRPNSSNYLSVQLAGHDIASKVVIVAVYFFIFCILVPGFLLLTGFRMDTLWSVSLPSTVFFHWASGGLVLVGGLITALGMAQLWFQGKGLPISDLPPTRFVATGLYRIWRHPIYVGFTLLFAGVGCSVGSFWCLAFSTPLLLLGWFAYVLFYEEPVLVRRFGPTYQVYVDRVHLLIPFPLKVGASRWLQKMAEWASGYLRTLANHTVLFRIGPVIVVTYGVFLAIGAMLMATVTIVALIQHGVETRNVTQFIVLVAFFVGPLGWLFWWFGNIRRLRHERFWGIGQVGFVSYGALVSFALVSLYMAPRIEANVFLLTDALMQGLFLAYALGRIGCLTYGCCYGKETLSHFHVVYKNPDAKMIRLGDDRPIARHPSQLYAMVHGIVAYLILYLVSDAGVPAGLITALGLMIAGIGRTFTESYRDRNRPIYGRFTWGHLGGWILCIGGWLLLWVVTPVVNGDSSISFSARVLLQHMEIVPTIGVVGLITLVVFGVHWKRIGVWFE